MTITREQVADLRPGDVVELTSADWPEGTVVRGPLWMLDGETLQVGACVIRHWDGRHPFNTSLHLTVISRTPRPLYVNHDRTEPVPGDVVRDADGYLWMRDGFKTWQGVESTCEAEHQDTGLPEPRTLLVDGTNGEVIR